MISVKGGVRCNVIIDFKVVLYCSVYDTYSYQLIPIFGELIANDRESYQYLVESIRQFPDQVSN